MKVKYKHRSIILFALLSVVAVSEASIEEEEHGVYYPTDCEVCKYVTVELEARLKETGKTHERLKIGSNPMKSDAQKIIKYSESELRLTESLEGLCDRILEYNIHKERKDSTRFAKGRSVTFQTLHGLVDKGVKVDLGIPYELWDNPSAEVVMLKTKCETLLEQHEDDIEDWFFNHRDVPLQQFLCSHRALKKGDDDCLLEALASKNEKSNKATKKTTNKSNKTPNNPNDEL